MFELPPNASSEDIELIGTVNQAISWLRENHLTSISAKIGDDQLEPKIAYKMREFVCALICRFLEATEATYLCWNQGNKLGAIVLVRVLFESTALLYDLNKKIERCCQTENFAEIDDYIMNRCFSEAAALKDKTLGIKPTLNIEALNVQTLLNVWQKESPFVKQLYAYLSELVHPCGLSVFHSYAQIQDEGLKTVFFSRMREEPFKVFYASIYCIPVFMVNVKDFLALHSKVKSFAP